MPRLTECLTGTVFLSVLPKPDNGRRPDVDVSQLTISKKLLAELELTGRRRKLTRSKFRLIQPLSCGPTGAALNPRQRQAAMASSPKEHPVQTWASLAARFSLGIPDDLQTEDGIRHRRIVLLLSWARFGHAERCDFGHIVSVTCLGFVPTAQS